MSFGTYHIGQQPRLRRACPFTEYMNHECEDGIEKSVPRITVWHHEACRVMTNGVHEGQNLYPIFIRIMDYFSCSLLNIAFSCWKKAPRSPWKRWDAKQHDGIILTEQWHHLMTICVTSNTTNVQPSHDSLGKIAWERQDFLSQGTISDILIWCARKPTLLKIWKDNESSGQGLDL